MMLVFLLSALVSLANARDPRAVNVSSEQLVAALQPVLDEVAVAHNASFSVGVRTVSSASISVQSGFNNRARDRETPLRASDRFPLGSVTKSFTATAVMRLQEAGLIDIDEPISKYVDPLLKRQNGTTMFELWNNDSLINNVTARDLMSMRGGLNDYDDVAYRNFVFSHPGEYWTPFDMLHALNKSWTCHPGTCGVYSSPGFDILGLALAQIRNCSTWQEYDQLDVFPDVIRSQYNGTAFPGEQLCSADPAVVHQYSLLVNQTAGDAVLANQTVVSFPDVRNLSCLNGWTCGGIVATTHDVANWYYDLFQIGTLVSNASLMQMLSDIPLTKGWSPGLRYGLGLSQMHLGSCDRENLTWTIGHGGADYGSTGHIAGFNGRFGFSIAVAANSVAPMNCSAEYKASHPLAVGALYSEAFYMDAVCRAYDAVLQTITNGTVPKLNCSKVDLSDVVGSARRKHQSGGTTNYTCNWDFSLNPSPAHSY